MTQPEDDLTKALLEHYQRDFPLVSRPFESIARALCSSKTRVLDTLIELRDKQVLTRVGPVFDHKRAGASLLAAVSVPSQESDKVADIINRYPEVNHNYGREHFYNLWFVVTAPNQAHLTQTLITMENEIGLPILRLPMIKSYHIDLGFQLAHGSTKLALLSQYAAKPIVHIGQQEVGSAVKNITKTRAAEILCELDQRRLRSLIQDGLPLCEKPFEKLAQALGSVSEKQVINTLKLWLKSGLVKRIGLINNHHQLGFTSNAMVVWNVPEDKIDQAGEIIKESGLVSLCYQRKRQLPEWPFNLYCMIHSRNRQRVVGIVAQLSQLSGLESMPSEVLFTSHQYKQKAGFYSPHFTAGTAVSESGHLKSQDPLTQRGVA